MRKEKRTEKALDEFYKEADILDEIVEDPIEFTLDEDLLRDILSQHRKRKLENVTIKIDPVQLRAIRKVATTKSIPYQTLVRHWLSEQLKRELSLTK
jgi:predicted DNA binding CopG/RHH family protein